MTNASLIKSSSLLSAVIACETAIQLQEHKTKGVRAATLLKSSCYLMHAGASDGSLRLNADVLAKIYMCTITQWNDPMIVALNPNVR